MKTGLIVLGNQLFDPALLTDLNISRVFMREDVELCTYQKFHKLKLILFLSAMRSYRDELETAGFTVDYQELVKGSTYDKALEKWIIEQSLDEIIIYEIEDKFFERRLIKLCESLSLKIRILSSPMFLTSRSEFSDYLEKVEGKPFMRSFYEARRRSLDILVGPDGKPTGGRWSFDDQNRKPLPKTIDPPKLMARKPTVHTLAVRDLVNQHFPDHPGETVNLWFATNRANAEIMLHRFLTERFANFGAYEDALTTRSVFVFHSALTPYLNTGLLTPARVIEKALEIARLKKINIASVEGFVRQVIGWREFIRGVYQNFSEKQDESNFWKHKKKLSHHWYDGSTGIPPLDDVIRKVNNFGYAHHIERLMIVGNLMLLLEIAPKEAHRWFMEMFVDSSDWVMGPNVYGMGIFSDGGIFATKPYICGSNYYRKMGHYPKGDWCDAVDGLYWSFVEKHKAFFGANPRLSMIVRNVENMKADRKAQIYKAADDLRTKLSP